MKQLGYGLFMLRLIAFAMLCQASLPCRAEAGVTEVVYPAPESPQDVRDNDLVEILHSALEHTVASYGPYRLRPSHLAMNEARQLVMLSNGGELNITWSSTSDEKERTLLAIRIPLRKGLLGYRIALIAKSQQPVFDLVQSADDLTKLVVGQGIGWGDAGLYNRDGFKVVTANYDQLFRMTAAKRFDFFPRGIGEIFKEYDTQAPMVANLAIEQHLLIVYPWPYYFFFKKSDTALAGRIEAGLRAMLKDGSYDAIFEKYNRADIERANLKNRRIIRINNPFLPKDTPLDDPTLWFDPTKGF